MFFSSSLLKKYWRRIILAFPDKVSPKSVSFFLQSQYVEKKNLQPQLFHMSLLCFKKCWRDLTESFLKFFEALQCYSKKYLQPILISLKICIGRL